MKPDRTREPSEEGLRVLNPLLPGLGVCDPHLRVFRGVAWLYATHDRGPENTTYAMDDWWLWTSEDLVRWRKACVLKPEETYLARPFDGCWATDAAERNGRFYWYFSERNLRTGVMVSDSPEGPWRDPLGNPLIGDGVVPVGAYDPGVFTDVDGTPYIVFGVWDFYLARLNDDMISLAGAPEKIEIQGPEGPYGPGRTDDKPFLHFRNGLYYLSWGCYYGISERVQGPYRCMGSFLHPDGVHPSMVPKNHSVTLDRHGSFFLWKDRWYFLCNDFSRSGNPFFRDSVLCPVEYGPDGEILPVRILPKVPLR